MPRETEPTGGSYTVGEELSNQLRDLGLPGK